MPAILTHVLAIRSDSVVNLARAIDDKSPDVYASPHDRPRWRRWPHAGSCQRDGSLPNLAALRRRGRAWALTSAWGATDDALWASFQYGVGVGEHGRYGYIIRSPSGHPFFAVEDERDRDTFWDGLSRHGLRVALLDVPKCRPPRPLNGIHLADWLVHGRYFDPGPVAYPETLAAELLRRFGEAPIKSMEGFAALAENVLIKPH